jgi:hypothetical protein
MQRNSIVTQLDDVVYKMKNGVMHPETRAIADIIDKRWDALVSDQGN